MQIEVKVNKHPSGRHTLTERAQVEMTPRDGVGELFGNADAGSFYRAVAQRLSVLHHEGHILTYHDAPK